MVDLLVFNMTLTHRFRWHNFIKANKDQTATYCLIDQWQPMDVLNISFIHSIRSWVFFSSRLAWCHITLGHINFFLLQKILSPLLWSIGSFPNCSTCICLCFPIWRCPVKWNITRHYYRLLLFFLQFHISPIHKRGSAYGPLWLGQVQPNSIQLINCYLS